ncbi:MULTISPECIES: FG-GAP repeat domain-containing protein [Bradyrhizobium]|uniref:FG-GAP repeat domain-containing protein n=2 Tax=Nitrobacteraceae TaxID=41294 RepID=UPI0003F7E8E3|nr:MULTISPECIES: VCBS repeat-containing protein [Bradyrhizobium]UFW53238.1 VCBS repeat-containing protein [Bradyrhizobium arachidis]
MATSPPTFGTQTSYATGTSPQSVAIGDVNGDGRPDLVSANRGSNTVSVLLGNGDGTFQAQTAYAAGNAPNAVAIGDVNGDGRLDIVEGGLNGGTVVLIGNGDGTFRSPISYASPGASTSIVLADLNGDGRSDVVELNQFYGVTLMLNNGDGSFGAPRTILNQYQGDAGVLSLAVGDLNGDGRPDLAAGQWSYTVSIVLGNGDGTFQAQHDYTTPYVNPYVTIGDVNGDGRPDVGGGNMLFLGNGDGTFTVATHLVDGPGGIHPAPINFPDSQVLLDLNGDGRPDAASSVYGQSYVSVQLGNGDGTFGPGGTYAVGQGNQPVVAADLNGDGRPDLVVPNSATNSLSVLINTGPTRVVSVTASQAYGLVHPGDTIAFTITMNRAVIITGGTPTLTLNDSGVAIYDAAATAALGDPAKLVFSYTVGASDLPVNGLSFVRGDQNGSQIVDAAGVGPDLSGVFAASFAGIQVATPPTTVTSVVASPTDGVEHVGDTMTFTVTMSRAVTVTGQTLTFTLNDGGVAVYDAAATAALGDPAKMVFNYTVGAADLPVYGLSFVRGDQNGTVIVDGMGRGPDFSGMFTASFAGIQVETPPTTVTSVVASPSNGVEHVGDTVVFTVTMSRAVTVTGDGLTFTLNDGGIVVYDAAATAALGDPTKMVFSYTVGATDLPVSGLSFVRGDQNGSVIVDGMGRGPDFSGIFAVLFSGIQVGPVAPAVLTAGPELQAASVNGAAVAELTGGNFAIAWLDGSTVHAQILAPDGTKVGAETVAQMPFPLLAAPGAHPSVTALANGGFAVAWAASYPGLGVPYAGVEIQLFAPNGFPAGAPFHVETESGQLGFNLGYPGLQVQLPTPSVAALADGSLVVTWVHRDTLNGDAILRSQTFDTNGTMIGNQVDAVLDKSGGSSPALARFADGSFVAVWNQLTLQINPVGTPPEEVKRPGFVAQIFDAQGNKIGAEIAVNSTIGYAFTSNPNVAVLSTGGFVVTWEEERYNGAAVTDVIMAQQFDAGGTKIGYQIRIDAMIVPIDAFVESQPKVTALADGNFAIMWQGASSTGGTVVKAQLFDAYQQSPVGSEVAINVQATQDQVHPQLVASQDGGFAIAWSDVNGEKVQVYAANQPVTTIAAGTTLDIPSASTAKLAFAPGGATLQLDNSDGFAGSITGFGGGDRIDLSDIAFSSGGTTLGYSANASNSGGHLTVSDGPHIASLTLLGQYAATSFVLTSDGHGGTLITAAQDAANQSQLAAHA